MSTRTFRDRVADYLRSRPGEWVDGLVLEEIGGRYAWRSRVSDARKQLGLHIENRQRRVITICGRRVISEYRYLPPASDLLTLSERAS